MAPSAPFQRSGRLCYREGMIKRPTVLRAAVLAGAIALAGCSAIPADSELMATPPPAEAKAQGLSFTAAGVPGLAPDTVFSKKAVEAALPGFEVSPVTMATEGSESVMALAAFRDGLQIYQILPGADGRIGAVHGVSERLVGPGGERIGMTFRAARVDRAACREGSGNWLGMPICKARTAPNITLVFSIPGYVWGGGLPESATLGTATLQRMIWTPPAS